MSRILSSMFVVLMLVMSMGLSGCSSNVVPPGTVVIVLTASGDSTIYNDGSYMSYGRDRVYFIDTKLKSFTERLFVLCEDNINMTVDVKWVGSFNVSKESLKVIKEKVPSVQVKTGDIEGYQLSLDEFYKTAMRDIVLAKTRGVVSTYSTDVVRENQNEIEAELRKAVTERFKELGYPVSSTDIMISNLDYPDEVTNQRKAIKNAQLEDEKQAALAKASIAQAAREAGIAREKGKAKIEEARADAVANEIRTASLTPAIIQMRQWDVLEKIGGLDGDLIILPYEAFGGNGGGSSFMNTAMTTKAIKQGTTKKTTTEEVVESPVKK